MTAPAHNGSSSSLTAVVLIVAVAGEPLPLDAPTWRGISAPAFPATCDDIGSTSAASAFSARWRAGDQRADDDAGAAASGGHQRTEQRLQRNMNDIVWASTQWDSMEELLDRMRARVGACVSRYVYCLHFEASGDAASITQRETKATSTFTGSGDQRREAREREPGGGAPADDDGLH